MEDVSYGEDGPEQQQRQPPAVADNKSPTGKVCVCVRGWECVRGWGGGSVCGGGCV